MGSKTFAGGILVGVAVIAGGVSYVAFSGSDEVTEAIGSDSITPPVRRTAELNPVYVDVGEVVVGPAVLVPLDVSTSGRQVSINFDLHQLTPVEGLPPGAAFVPFQGFVAVEPFETEVVFPTDWILVVDGAEVPGTVANPDARAARFDIPDGVTASRVEAAWIDGYLIRVPLDIPFTLSSDEPRKEVVPGVAATLVQALDQNDTTIVRVELSVSDQIDLSGFDVVGAGNGVVSSNREAEGGPRWNITFEGRPGQAEWQFTLVGTLWHKVEGRIDVPLEGFNG
jgi:hypothetical protein